MHQLLAAFVAKKAPAVFRRNQLELVRFLSGGECRCSPQELAVSLCACGEDHQVLMDTILRCELLLLQLAGDLQPMVHMARCGGLCTHLSTAIRHARTEVRLEHEELQVVDASIRAWRQEGGLRLHNFFCEMPVTAKVDFFGAHGAYLEVAANAEVGRVFAVGQDMQHGYVRMPDGEFVMQVGLHSCRQGRMKLAIRSLAPSVRERRKEIRIRTEEGFDVELHSFATTARVSSCDISLSGLCIRSGRQLNLKPGQTVGLRLQLSEEPLFLEGQVRWVEESGNRVGIRYIGLGPFEEALQQSFLEVQR